MPRRCRSGSALLLALALAAGCDGGGQERADAAVPGDPERGRSAVREYGCGSCHTVPGVSGANGTVGPPLAEFRRQAYIAGVLPNTPENLVRWIRDPRSITPRTAMPDTGVTEADARHLTAYLYRSGNGRW